MSKKLTTRGHARRVREHYLPRLKVHGPGYRAVDWGSVQGQELRFRVLLEVGDCLHASILDVGCGVGDLAHYLQSRGASGTYRGLDVLPEMVANARQHHPGRKFETGDLLAPRGRWRADYVLASGVFTFSDAALMRRSVAAMFAASRKAVAFNALSAWAASRERGEFHADPLTTLEFCRTLTPWVVLRQDYHPRDFTIYLYKARNA